MPVLGFSDFYHFAADVYFLVVPFEKWGDAMKGAVTDAEAETVADAVTNTSN